MYATSKIKEFKKKNTFLHLVVSQELLPDFTPNTSLYISLLTPAKYKEEN